MADSVGDANPEVRPKRRIGLVLFVVSLLVLGLGAFGIWKSNNFDSVEVLDYFICTGMIDGRPLLAELSFQKDKDVLALIVFPDGRHWSLAGRRFENGQYSWNLLDPESNVVGQLRGEWDSKTGKFSGRLIGSGSHEKPAIVELQRVAQFVRHVVASGLRVGPFGRRLVFDFTQPRFEERTGNGEFCQGAMLNQQFEHLFESQIEEALPHIRNLDEWLKLVRDSWDEGSERFYVASTHLVAISNTVASGRQPWTYLADSDSWSGLMLFSYNLIGVETDEFRSEDVFVADKVDGEQLRDLIMNMAVRTKVGKFAVEQEVNSNDQTDGEGSSSHNAPSRKLIFTSFCLEPGGIRFLCTHDILGHGYFSDDFEVLVPWSELRPYLKSDGPARYFMSFEQDASQQ